MATETRLTEKDKIAYSAISEFIKENGYPPTIRELCIILGKSSTGTIQKRLESLESKGYIKTTSMGKRTIRLTKGIEEQTTMEVVHGRWIEYRSFMKCSECGSHWYYADNNCHLFDYCPSCGAKMDGDGNG